jgi:hypothetical protein
VAPSMRHEGELWSLGIVGERTRLACADAARQA